MEVLAGIRTAGTNARYDKKQCCCSETTGVCTDNLNAGVAVMKSTEDGA
jgi:hypothetical protein